MLLLQYDNNKTNITTTVQEVHCFGTNVAKDAIIIFQSVLVVAVVIVVENRKY